jgi:hypothetical protein
MMSACSIRIAIKAAALGLTACAILASVPAAAVGTEDDPAPIPFSRITQDFAGDTVAEAAFHSSVPILIVAGATYKLADLAHDIGDAAVNREDRWVGAEMILADDDARRLKEIKIAGGDLNGADANAIKQRLRDRALDMTVAQKSPFGYTIRIILKNFPYAVAKVTIDRAIEKTIGLALEKSGFFKLVERFIPLPQKINWMLNYGGPLETFEKGQGWGRLGTRARAAEKAAEESMRDQEKKMVANYLSSDRTETFERSAADALANIYKRTMIENPSRPRAIVAAQFRLEVARAAVSLPAPAIAAAVPAGEDLVPEAPDPIVRTIQADDASGWKQYSNPVSSERRTVESEPTRPAVEREDPAVQARHNALHEELMRVGDGKTFQVCSKGCPSPSGSSWDGTNGQTLYGK